MILKGRILPENDLIKAIKNKSRIGAETLYDMYAKSLYGIIIKVVKNKEIAEDTLQKTFLKIWDSFEHYNASKGRLFTWMLAVTTNTVRDTLRSLHYRQHINTDSIDGHVAEIEERYYSVYNIDTIGARLLIDKLKEEHKHILDLIYFQGYTQSEVAKELNIPLGTVKTHCRKAIQTLRDIYNKSNAIIKLDDNYKPLGKAG
ncbi:MAG: sigma-70 family polymerase sigma factor [Mucilaginibacter sp.]|nr:sigma-70 family polymerase sigma factor [Mucilaginibacter sp.]